MKEEFEFSLIKGRNTQEAKNLCQRHNIKDIPYTELRRGGSTEKYGLKHPVISLLILNRYLI